MNEVYTLADEFVEDLTRTFTKPELVKWLNTYLTKDVYQYNVHMSNKTYIEGVEQHTGYRIVKISGEMIMKKGNK